MSERQENTRLDTAVVDELRDIMGDDFAVLVESFDRDSRQRIEGLDAAIKAGEADQVRHLAHSFKGSSSNLGAVTLSALCRELEFAGTSGDLSSATLLLKQITDEFDAVQQLLIA